MKKFMLLAGLNLGIGFLLGSKAGAGPYHAFEERVRSILNRPEVEDAFERAKDEVTAAVDKVNAKVPSSAAEAFA